MLSNEVIYECPNSYFDSELYSLYSDYASLLLKKKLGITVDPSQITQLELEAYIIFDGELASFHEKKMQDEIKRENQNGHGTNTRNKIHGKGRR